MASKKNMGVVVDVTGALKGLKSFDKALAISAKTEINTLANDIVSTAKSNAYSPHDTGALANSIHAEKDKFGVAIVAGGHSVNDAGESVFVDYALQVHEEPQSMRRTGQSQFLVKAVLAHVPELNKKILVRGRRVGFNRSLSGESKVDPSLSNLKQVLSDAGLL